MKDTIHLSSSKQSILATGLDSLDDIQDIINWAGPLVNDEEVIIFASEPLEETVEGLSDNVFFVPTQDVTPLLVVMKDQKEQKQINFVPPHKKALSLAQHLEKSENTMIKDGFCYQHELDSD
jgi:superfamily II DNA/RNA helicase